MSQPITVTEARALLVAYVNAIDRGELKRWPEFFTDEAVYRITTHENEERGLPLSIMLCSNRAMRFDRLESLERANVFEPHRYRHVMGDTEIVSAGPGRATLRTSFVCVRIMVDGDTTLFVSGEYRDELVRGDGGLALAARTVVLDQSRIDTLIAIPL
jgi:anthranilate 1,2-dioxygenase small subunit